MSLDQLLNLKKPPVFLMDGTAFIYRSYYANRHLRRSDGFPTNALVLVTRILLRILRQEKPRYFLFAMDGKGRNLRKDIYAEYKANREAMPEDLAVQIEPVKAIVKALGLASEVTSGHEADDCIAALAHRFASERPVVIVSGDKDLKQCLGPDVFMWDPGTKEEKLITAADFEAENGVRPDQWADVQALTGDSSDNIPGVPGIGPKTAREIFKTCANLEDIRANLEKLPAKLQGKLANHLDDMFIWRKLTTLNLEACPNLQLEDLEVRPANLAECEKLAKEFELNSIYREISTLVSSSEDTGKQHLKAPQKPAPTPGLPPATAAPDVSSLPPCQGQAVALIWPDGVKAPPRIAIADLADFQAEGFTPDALEYNYGGKQAQLCAWLAQASAVIVPDLKELLVASPSWRKLLADNPDFPVIDLSLQAWLLDPEDGRYAWVDLARRRQEEIDDPQLGPATLALTIASSSARLLAKESLDQIYREIELPLVPVLADMQARGFAIDPAAFQHFLADVEEQLGALTQKIYSEAGMEFNVGSSRQLGEVLFGKLGLPESKRTRTGQPSTSQATLEKLAPDFPIVDTVLEYRKLEKMRSTYLDPLPRLMDANNRIHSTFNQKATATGRISSSDPNLQNIPVRGPLGARMRACFVPGPGNLLIAADYSQIELRVLAHLSQDEHLLTAFREGEDIHARTASLIFDTAQDKLNSDQRRMAKTINFGLLYGMGARKLSQELKISTTQAKEFIDRYFAMLQGLKTFYAEILKGARENIFVKSMAGRKRWLPDIHSDNGQALAQAERQAINAVIQGTAADIMKLAMLAVANDTELKKMNAGIVLQVHDELLLEAPERLATEAASRVAKLMESVKPGGIPPSVPLKVEWGTGKNWAAAH